MTQSVVVVGAAGFIGRHLVRALAADGFRTCGTCRPATALPSASGVSWLETDLTAGDPTREWPERCDAVVHLAQSRRWRDFPEGVADVVSVNVSSVVHAAEYARRAGARRFVFVSTGSIYGPAEHPVTEEDIPAWNADRPFYVASKLAAEAILSGYGSVFHAAVLRLFVPYGAGQDPRMLIPELVRRIRNGRPVTLDGADGLVANPIHVCDVVAAIERTLSLDRAVTLNVAGPEVLTLRAIAETVGRVLGRGVEFDYTGAPARWLVGDTKAMTDALGWAPSTDFSSGIRETLAPETIVEGKSW